MKAVIVEINKGFAAALTDDGCIKKVKNKNYQIGQVIEMKKSGGYKKVAVWAAAAAIFVLVFSFGAYAEFAPYSYVSLDVNPSIELTLNRFDRVLSVKAVNDDGLEIIKEIDLKNKKVDVAIEIAIDKITEAGFLDGEEEGGVVVSASAGSVRRAEILAEKLQKRIENELKERHREAVVEAVSVGKERVKEARELGVTPGKLRLVEKLKESALDPDSIVIEEWLDKPVKEINAAIKANRQANKANEKAERDAEKKRQNGQDEDALSNREIDGSEDEQEKKNGEADRDKGSDNRGNNKENARDNIKDKIRERISSQVSERADSDKKDSSSNGENKAESKKNEDNGKLSDNREGNVNNTVSQDSGANTLGKELEEPKEKIEMRDSGNSDKVPEVDTKENINKASNQNNAVGLTDKENKADSNNGVGNVKK